MPIATYRAEAPKQCCRWRITAGGGQDKRTAQFEFGATAVSAADALASAEVIRWAAGRPILNVHPVPSPLG